MGGPGELLSVGRSIFEVVGEIFIGLQCVTGSLRYHKFPGIVFFKDVMVFPYILEV